MIILTLILMGISLIVFVARNRQRRAFWLSGLFISFILTNIGLMFYYSKMGGLTKSEQILFFLDSGLQMKIQSFPLILDIIARMLNVGKQMFIYFALMFSLHLTGKLSFSSPVCYVPVLWPLANCLLGDPYFYVKFTSQGQVWADRSSLICIVIYSLISLFFLIQVYLSYNVGWILQKLRYILLFVFNLMIYFFFFCQINATSVFYSTHIQLQNMGFKIYSLRFSLSAWVLVIGLFIFFLITGLNSLLLYTKIDIDERLGDLSLERQLDTANMGIRVFIHGIKNQLLAERILLTHMKQDMAEEADPAKLTQYATDLTSINQNMTTRIEALYKAFRYNSMTLTPRCASEIISLSLEKLSKKSSAVRCRTTVAQDCTILADTNYLSEAIYNILVNAAEAIQAIRSPEEGLILVHIRRDHRYCVIEITDNGIGMSKEKQKKIFDPFFTDKNTNYSWGIGLSYVRQTVKYHFGNLHVDSRVNEGTTFRLAFPVYTQKKPAKGVHHEST